MTSNEYKEDASSFKEEFKRGISNYGHEYALAFAIFYGVCVMASAIVRAALIKKS